MIADLVRVVGVEGLVADVAQSLLVVHVRNSIMPLGTHLIVVECHRLRLESPHLSDKPLDAILPHPGLIPNVDFGEGGHDVVPHRAGCLTHIVKRSVPSRGMILPYGDYQRLEVCVDQEWRLHKVSAIG